MSAICINSCIVPFFDQRYVGCNAREVRSICYRSRSQAIIGRGAVAANVVLPTSPSSYTTIKIDGFSVGSKTIKDFHILLLLQVAAQPHLDEEIRLAVAKLYDFVNTSHALCCRSPKCFDASNHELHGMVQRFQPRNRANLTNAGSSF